MTGLLISLLILILVLPVTLSIQVTTLNHPANNSFHKIDPIDFNFTAEDDQNVSSCTLYANFSGSWSPNTTIYPVTNNSQVYNITLFLAEGKYLWNIMCLDNDTNSAWYQYNYTLTVDRTSPAWNSNKTNASSSTKTGYAAYFNLTLTDLNPDKYIFSFYDGTEWTNDTASPFQSGAELTKTKTIHATRGQIIQWYFWSNDSAANTNTTPTWELTINNTAPTHTTPILNATNSSNYTTEDLTCFNQSLSDPDNDALKATYRWYKNNLLQPDLENYTLVSHIYTTKEEIWNCEVQPYDGYDYGIALNSTSLTIRNSPPRINLNNTLPGFPVEGDLVYIYANATDSDNDIKTVNLTLFAPNGTAKVNNQNASSRDGDIWNSTTFIIDAVGTWSWNISATDGDLNTSTWGNLTLLSWQIIKGNVSGKLTLQDDIGSSLVYWIVNNTNDSNIYVTDSDNTLDFNSLRSLSRDLDGEYHQDDFEELDTIVGTTLLSDSINLTFTSGRSPILMEDFIIFGKTISLVPIINSTNTSNFITGILWDSHNDTGNSQFDLTDRESVVFVTKVNKAKQGKYGIYDYEIKIPANLRKYRNTTQDTVSFYTEIK